MRQNLTALLLLTLWLGACASNPTVAETGSTPDVASTAPAESAPTESSDLASAQREAVLSDFENEVAVRAGSDGEFIPAVKGFVLTQGGSLQTGETGRARLDLMPEGTIIRVAPNSAFTLPEITEKEGTPKTSIELFFGKIFVLLNGGSLDVETPSGVASVRGSLLSVSFNPSTGRIQAVCLEGHCELVNEDGEVVDLVEGESAYVDELGEIFEIIGIDQDEIQEWLEEAPELNEFLVELPDPENYPQYEEFQEYEFDPSTYENGGDLYFFEENASPTNEPGATDLPGATDVPGSGVGKEEPGNTPDPSGGEPEATPPPDDGSGG